MTFLEAVILEQSLERWVDIHQVEGWGCAEGLPGGGSCVGRIVEVQNYLTV